MTKNEDAKAIDELLNSEGKPDPAKLARMAELNKGAEGGALVPEKKARPGVYDPRAGFRVMPRPAPKPEPVSEKEAYFGLSDPKPQSRRPPLNAPAIAPVVEGIDVETDEQVKAARAKFAALRDRWQTTEGELRELSARLSIPTGQAPTAAALEKLITAGMLAGEATVDPADVTRLQSLTINERCLYDAASAAAQLILPALDAARRRAQGAIAQSLAPDIREFALALVAAIRAGAKFSARLQVYSQGGWAYFVPNVLQLKNGMGLYPGAPCPTNPDDARDLIRALIADGILTADDVRDIPRLND